jgi:hypothetical protein
MILNVEDLRAAKERDGPRGAQDSTASTRGAAVGAAYSPSFLVHEDAHVKDCRAGAVIDDMFSFAGNVFHSKQVFFKVNAVVGNTNQSRVVLVEMIADGPQHLRLMQELVVALLAAPLLTMAVQDRNFRRSIPNGSRHSRRGRLMAAEYNEQITVAHDIEGFYPLALQIFSDTAKGYRIIDLGHNHLPPMAN